MRVFYSTCAAGLEEIAREACSSAKGFRPIQTLSGGLIYEAHTQNPHMPCFQNTYLLLARYDGVRSVGEGARRASKDGSLMKRAEQAMRVHGFRTFRVMFSERNALASVAPELRASIERGLRGSRVDRVSPETEITVLTRSEGFCLILLRLTRGPNKDSPQKGELSAGIAWCMVRLAFGGPSGVFLDPFAGHGALGTARMKLSGGKIMLGEIDRNLVAALRKKFPKERAHISECDALQLSAQYEKGSVTELVTDPPWGIYQDLPMPAEVFYQKMLREFSYVLSRTGRLVVLTADKQRFEAALTANGFYIKKRYDLLVHGKKAALFLACPPQTQG